MTLSDFIDVYDFEEQYPLAVYFCHGSRECYATAYRRRIERPFELEPLNRKAIFDAFASLTSWRVVSIGCESFGYPEEGLHYIRVDVEAPDEEHFERTLAYFAPESGHSNTAFYKEYGLGL